MEQMSHYRHIIPKTTKNVFIKSLKQAIKEIKPKHIGFIGVIGTLDKPISHDIDILLFPSEKAKIGETIIEINRLYDKTEEFLQKQHERYYLAISPKKSLQEITYYVATLEEGSAGMIPIHSLFFPDYPSFKSINPIKFKRSIAQNIVTFHGNFDAIKKLKGIGQDKLEPYFFILDFEMNARTKTFPRHLIRTSAESLFKYLHDKYKIPVPKKKIHNPQDVDKEMWKILKYLDSVSYK